MITRKLDSLLNPENVAIIGASANKESVGYALMNNLIGSGFDGTVFPVNPKRNNILGVKAYPNIKDVPDSIDLALISTPARFVPQIVEDCGQAGVKGIVLISAGFAEIGEEGQKLMEEIRKAIKKYNMRLIGPNCLGFINPAINLNASFANKMALPGNIAFISQSGALCTAILDWANQQNVGFSYFVSIGSMLDVSFNDLIDYFGSDSKTTSIIIYMESLKDARSFLSAARNFSRNKPIIILKAGKSSEGAQAAMSHTGSLAGNDAVFDAAFRRAGIVRVDTIGELFNIAQALSMQKRPRTKKLAIITNAGGPGVIATDALIANHGELAELSSETKAELDKQLSPNWSHNNPIDVLGDAGPEDYAKAVELCASDDNVGGILVILTPQAMTRSTEIAELVSKIAAKTNKTVLASWMGAEDVAEGEKILEDANVPVYDTPEDAVRAFMLMYDYSRNLRILQETPPKIPLKFSPKRQESLDLINKVLANNRTTMTEDEAKQLLDFYEIPVIKNGLAKTKEEAVELANNFGYPLVMKIASPDILHKTDVGGVVLNITNQDKLEHAFINIMKSAKAKMPNADIRGVLVEQMIDRKYELIIGGKRDPIFGPTIVFGMGGVAVEVFKDTTVGLPPLNMALALRLIENTKIYKLLKGYRGMPAADIESIQFLLYKFAYLLADFPQIMDIDINPFSIDENGGVVLDAKVILTNEKIDPKKPNSHLVIPPYPSEFVKKIKLKDRRPITLRPIKPEDEGMAKEMFSNFSERTQRYRFFQLIKNISHERLVRYTQIDYDREIAIIAQLEEDGKKKMAGVVRLISDQYNENAEFAIVVADPWHGLGLGGELADYVLEIAKKRGIHKIYAYVLSNNHIMIRMFKNRGFSIKQIEDEYYAEKILD